MQGEKKYRTPFWDTTIGNIIFVVCLVGMMAFIMWLFSLLTMFFKQFI